MKKATLTLILLACLPLLEARSATADAADYGYLIMQTANGNTTAIGTEGLVMTVENGTLVAKNSSTGATFTLSDLSKMYFASTSTGISTLAETASGPVSIYSAAGVCVGNFADFDAARRSLDKGVYIVKTKLLTSKIVVK